MESAVRFYRGSNKVLHLLGAGNIRLDKESCASFQFYRLDCFPPFRVDVADNDPGATAPEEERGGAANTGAATGNERYLVGEIESTSAQDDLSSMVMFGPAVSA
jgi:hypothetical protein